LRGKFITVLGLRTRYANFFQQKAGNSVEKQTAISLQNTVVTLPISTIGLFLRAASLTLRAVRLPLALKALRPAQDRNTAEPLPFCTAAALFALL